MATDSKVCHKTSLESPPTVQSIPLPRDGMDDPMKSKMKMHEADVVDMMSNLKLNPSAMEFVPASNSKDHNQKKKNNSNNYKNGNRWKNGRQSRAQIEDSIRRTVYVSEIDHHVTEELLAELFTQNCGQVVDCRICGDPHSKLRFAFIEFGNENSARHALFLSGSVIGFYSICVLPSKTSIQPVNPTFLPRSAYEREMCARTVYCTNIDQKVSHTEAKKFFESRCGKVSLMRLLGDKTHTTRIGFVEFFMAESATLALNCSGMILGTQYIRVSPSKTPVRPRMSRIDVHH